MPKTLAMILAGGAGTRLEPLTRERAKPAVPFGGRYRIVDFCLSNFANSGILKMKVLTQYKSDSLNNHLSRAWRMTAFLGHYVESVPAQMRTGLEWYKGSADAIYQNLNIITDEEPEHTFVFGADHVYRMDVRQMLDFHLERDADCTVAAIPVPIEQARHFGIIDLGPDGRMRNFFEKPSYPPPMPDRPDLCLASMGNYLFKTDCLVREVVQDAANEDSTHDFGKSIISELYKHSRVFVYDFAQNVVPGQDEKERGYWRDVGTSTSTTRRTSTWSKSTPRSISTTISGQSSPPIRTILRPSSCSRMWRRSGSAMRRTRWSRTGASSPAPTSTDRCSRPRFGSTHSPRSPTRSCSRTWKSVAIAKFGGRSSTRTSSSLRR